MRMIRIPRGRGNVEGFGIQIRLDGMGREEREHGKKVFIGIVGGVKALSNHVEGGFTDET